MTGCNEQRISVYRIPKENVPVALEQGSASGMPVPAPPSWTAPAGWQAQPLTEMRTGSFKVLGPDGASADVSVISFPGDAGGLESNLNRWRGQLQLPPLPADQLSQSLAPTTIGGISSYLVDLQTDIGSPKPSRILGAIIPAPDRCWFVKMVGEPGLLERDKPQFLAFVQSIQFAPGPDRGSAVPAKSKSTNDD